MTLPSDILSDLKIQRCRKYAKDLIPLILECIRVKKHHKEMSIEVLNGRTMTSFILSNSRINQIVRRTIWRAIIHNKNPHSLFSIGLSKRSKYALKIEYGISTVQDFMSVMKNKTDKELIKIPNFGYLSIRECKKIYKELLNGSIILKRS